MNNRLREAREKAGLSQKNTAKKCGISLVMYMYIERGTRKGSFQTWKKIQKALNIPDEEMWGVIIDKGKHNGR